jgi:hypothetical protein
MKNLLSLSMAAFASTTLGIIGTFRPIVAVDFSQQEVEQNRFVALAVPRIGAAPQLIILEQISDSQACWKENQTTPVTVEPLLTNFNFAGICGRSTDSNGYSIRMAGQDLALLYKLKLVRQNNEIFLVGISNTDPNASAIKIGSTRGIGNGVTKIELEPGWRFTKRSYNGEITRHVYLTSDRAAPGNLAQQQQTAPIDLNQTQYDSPQVQDDPPQAQNDPLEEQNDSF